MSAISNSGSNPDNTTQQTSLATNAHSYWARAKASTETPIPAWAFAGACLYHSNTFINTLLSSTCISKFTNPGTSIR